MFGGNESKENGNNLAKWSLKMPDMDSLDYRNVKRKDQASPRHSRVFSVKGGKKKKKKYSLWIFHGQS